ncbi:hypothetical protein [Pseudomonas sp. WS 5011]|jgi:hypothetical protein|uniref:hypothetical protein n=1 Tax=Pseudomonas sp. WS 5011 TaxID=2717477 RepID=UPI0014761397|nr:hypothetical protein [Pseudomonas sp. WS 5011]NMY53376.1 hypothetical protein [Pseudomonas sp. WS 5011]|tara:strand:- start:19004 stop:19234 length:231 start_codon:yes stop_codon:yes gene_type:complete
MKRENVKVRIAEGVIFDTQIMANPANTSEWIVMFKKDAGRSFFLIDDQEEIDSFSDLDSLVAELRKLGIRHTEIHL